MMTGIYLPAPDFDLSPVTRIGQTVNVSHQLDMSVTYKAFAWLVLPSSDLIMDQRTCPVVNAPLAWTTE